jgi:hypothetical protein
MSKKRLFLQKAKDLVIRSKYKTRPDYRRAINIVRKHLTRGWKLPLSF